MRLFFLGTSQDSSYLPRLKACVGSAQVSYSLEPIQTWVEVKHHCDKKGITNVFSTSASLLKILLHKQGEKKAPAISNYAGSMFFRDGISVVFVDPLDHLVSVPYGEHLLRRYISKLTSPESWVSSTPFVWDIVTPANVERIYESYKDAFAIAVDIETFKDKLAISCCGYTAIFIEDDGTFKTHSCVIPIDTEFNLAWMRKFNSLPIPKILQNGKYDHAYLARYNAPCSHYFWDTINLFHCWYSEMPKDLAFIQGYTLRESMYWKDLAQTSDLTEYYQYNCRDTHATANGWISMMLEIPEYARQNYLLEFPLVFPCHMSEMIGIKRDMKKLMEARAEIDSQISTHSASLDKMLGVTNFNVNSPVQMKALLKVLGCGDLESGDEKNLNKAAYRHPLNARIIEHILEVRGLRKLKSTYLRTSSDAKANGEGGAKEFNDVILFALNPHGTDTGRLASREHHFWCGLQIQNIPGKDKTVKSTLVAREGWLLAEADLEQAESRDTGYIAGETTLIDNVENSPDFHSSNASMFFGIPFSEIYDIETHHVINKPLRTLAKPVNHGANYNMGAGVLVETMGIGKTYEAQQLLNLPKMWTLKQIAEHLLAAFHKVYPKLKGVYYPGVIHEIKLTHMLVSRITSSIPWSRYCFGHPDTNKRDLNSYVAHSPQSLNAMSLNRAYMRVFYEVALPNPDTFHLLAQIHDSILHEFKEGHEYLSQQVKACMENNKTVIGFDGIERTYLVPAALKAGKDGKGSRRWSETEM